MSDTEQDVVETREVEDIEGTVRPVVQSADADVAWALIGAAVTHGDAYANTSAVGAVLSKSGVSLHQSLAGDVLTKGDVDVESGAVCCVGSLGDVSLDHSTAGAIVSRSTSVRGGKVGFVLSGRTEISDDSRIIMDGRSAAIFGFSLGAVIVLAFGALFGWGWWAYRRYEPRLTMPKVHLPHVEMPKFEWRR